MGEIISFVKENDYLGIILLIGIMMFFLYSIHIFFSTIYNLLKTRREKFLEEIKHNKQKKDLYEFYKTVILPIFIAIIIFIGIILAYMKFYMGVI